MKVKQYGENNMIYYKFSYKINNNERIYPPIIQGIIWRISYYHYTEKSVIGGTEQEIVTEGPEVIRLSDDEALSLIEEFKKSYPQISEEKLPFPLKEIAKATSVSATPKRSRKKRDSK